MDLRHLRYFLVAAEECHFTRAAKRLGIAQPPFSQQIQQLENELGFRLFDRMSRGVALTGAGQNFQAGVHAIFDNLNLAIESSRTISEGASGRINIGFTSSASYNDFVPFVIGAYRKLYPGVVSRLHETDSEDMLKMLRSGQLDVAFIRLAPDEAIDLPWDPLLEEDMRLAVPLGHKLGNRDSVALSELVSEQFVSIPRSNGRYLIDVIDAACSKHGFSPNIIQEAPQISTCLGLVAARIGIAFAPASMCHLHSNQVRFLKVDADGPRVALRLATRSLPVHAPATKFVQMVKQQARKR